MKLAVIAAAGLSAFVLVSGADAHKRKHHKHDGMTHGLRHWAPQNRELANQQLVQNQLRKIARRVQEAQEGEESDDESDGESDDEDGDDDGPNVAKETKMEKTLLSAIMKTTKGKCGKFLRDVCPPVEEAKEEEENKEEVQIRRRLGRGLDSTDDKWYTDYLYEYEVEYELSQLAKAETDAANDVEEGVDAERKPTPADKFGGLAAVQTCLKANVQYLNITSPGKAGDSDEDGNSPGQSEGKSQGQSEGKSQGKQTGKKDKDKDGGDDDEDDDEDGDGETEEIKVVSEEKKFKSGARCAKDLGRVYDEFIRPEDDITESTEITPAMLDELFNQAKVEAGEAGGDQSAVIGGTVAGSVLGLGALGFAARSMKKRTAIPDETSEETPADISNLEM